MNKTISLFIWIVIIVIVIGILIYFIRREYKYPKERCESFSRSDSSFDSNFNSSAENIINDKSDYVIKPRCPVCHADSNNQSVLSGDKNIWNIVCENGHIFNYQYIEASDNYRIIPGLYIIDESIKRLVCKLLYASMYYDTINDDKILSSLVTEDIKESSVKSNNLMLCPICDRKSIVSLDCDGSCSYCENHHVWHRSKSAKKTTELSKSSSISKSLVSQPISAYTTDVKMGKCPKCKYNDWRLEQIDELITPDIIKIFESGRCPRPDEMIKIN